MQQIHEVLGNDLDQAQVPVTRSESLQQLAMLKYHIYECGHMHKYKIDAYAF